MPHPLAIHTGRDAKESLEWRERHWHSIPVAVTYLS